MDVGRAVGRRVVCGVVVGGVSLLALPAAGEAGTVVVRHENDREGRPTTPVASFQAASGERNDVALAHNEDEGVVIVTDAAAPVSPGEGCVPVDAFSARCSARADYELRVSVELGDLDDTLWTVPRRGVPPIDLFTVVANGGAGDDVIDARHATAAGLDGGGGVDQLLGSRGNDVLTDGDRDDAVGAGAPDQDGIDGGPGSDHISYAQRTAPVFVDLADNLLEGEIGEGDVVRDVEGVSGGSGDDRLAGNALGNVLDGGPGRDTLIGRGGDDFVGWAYGRPPVLHQWELPGFTEWPFHVHYRAVPAFGDVVSCGRGRDQVWGRRAHDFVEPACELIGTMRRLPMKQADGSFLAPASLPAYPIQRRTSFAYQVHCGGLGGDDFPIVHFRCSGSVRLREASGRRRLLASGAIPRGTGGSEQSDGGYLTARLQVTELGRKLATRPRGVRATLRVRGKNLPTAAWIIRLRIR